MKWMLIFVVLTADGSFKMKPDAVLKFTNLEACKVAAEELVPPTFFSTKAPACINSQTGKVEWVY